MNKITSWILNLFHKKELQEQEDCPFIVKNETDALKSSCVLDIEHEVEEPWLSIKSIEHRLGIKTVQNNSARLNRSGYGTETVSPNPVFTLEQIAKLKSKFWLHRVVIISFCIAESFLYCLTAALFVPGGGLALQIPVAIFLALVIMLALDYAFEQHLTYREVMERHSKKEINDSELRKYQDMRYIGYLIMAIAAAAIIFAGFARVLFLEGTPPKNLSPEKALSVARAGKMASIFTMLITILTALFMAMIKRDQTKLGIRYRVFKSWENAHVKRNDYTQTLINDAEKIKTSIEKSLRKYWLLVIDSKRALKMKTEHDTKNQSLDDEYMKLIAQPDFVLNDYIYRKFSFIQAAHEELFFYGVLNAAAIKEKLKYVTEILSVPKEHLAEHLAAIPKHKEPDDILLPKNVIPATNGKVKEQQN